MEICQLKTWTYQDVINAKNVLNEALEILQSLILFTPEHESSRMEITCEMIIKHIQYLERITIKLEET